MPTLTNDMMRSIILDHYSNPLKKHAPEGDGYQMVHMHSDNCIDDLNIYLKVEGDIVKSACFEGVACAISTASTDIMCEVVVEVDSYLVFDELFARFDDEPADDDECTEQSRDGEGIVPAVCLNEESRDDRGEDAADIAPEIDPAGNRAAEAAAKRHNR